MEFNDAMVVAVSVVAVVLSLVAIFFEVFFYRWQTQQGDKIREDVNSFAKEMHAALAELKGISSSTQDTVKEQQDMLLKAVLEQKGISLKQETSPIIEQLSKRIEAIEKSTDISETKGEIQQLNKTLQSLKGTLDEASYPAMPLELPHLFYGSVTINNSPAPAGVEVIARIDNKVVAKTSYDGTRYALTIAAPVGASYKRKEIRFYLGDKVANEKAVFDPGDVTRLNLTCGSDMPFWLKKPRSPFSTPVNPFNPFGPAKK